MARAAVRATVGLLLALALGLMLAPVLWSAGAQPQDAPRLPQTTNRVTITLRATTTTLPAPTSPPPSSSVLTTPTTRGGTISTRPRVVTGGSTTTTANATTTTTSTTVAPLPAAAPPPVTLPLTTAAQSGSISPFFSVMSAIGFFCLAGLLTAQWFLTRPGRRGPTL